jgi:hypothetical protein
LGARSLLNNISGNANVAIGEFALSQTQIANQNVAIGYESGKFMTTGSKNSILGSFTGAHPSLDIRTLSNYVVLSDGDGNPRLWINDTGAVNIPGGMGITGSLSITGGTVTANNPVLSATQTWNNAAVTFTGWQLDVTDTASNAASLLMDLRVGGVSALSAGKGGAIFFGAGSSNYIARSGGSISIAASFGDRFFVDGIWGVAVTNGASFGFVGSGIAAPDVSLFRDAADTLAQRRGVNAQAFRIYNTFTDASNYERGKVAWSANVLQIGTENAGTGLARALELQTGGTTKLIINTSTSVESSAGISIFSSADFRAASSGSFYWNGRTNITSPSNGTILIGNLAQNDFGRMMFGSTTSSFPALKRNGASLETRLADDSSYAPHAMQYLDITDGIAAPGAAAGRARIYVDTADGDLKVVFADGTVKTIVVDT